ncbi:MAG: toxin-antitoxin system protein [Oscillospiraceae bacterium]|nr:toxin-antitoxin system protein [Oscillospiraceae bacterium]MBR3083889.1 toxin-antitoxin system protein [Oscillospiraceae bacterium]
MKPLKEKISITIDWDLLAQLRQRAEQDDRSLSQYINLLLKAQLEIEKAKERRLEKRASTD